MLAKCLNLNIVRTRFVSNHNSVGFARKKTQTISFVEHGFERLGLSHQAVSLSWCLYMAKSFSSQESFSWRRAGRLWFLAIFPSPPYELLSFPFILAGVFLSFVHVQNRHSKTDTCPISPYPEWLGVVEKTGEYGSVMCRVLNGSKGSFPRSFTLSSIPFSIGTYILDFFQVVSIPFLPFLPRRLWTSRGLNRPRLYPNEIGRASCRERVC